MVCRDLVNQYGGQVLAWGLLCVAAAGAALVVVSASPDDPPGAAGFTLIALSGIGLATIGLRRWRRPDITRLDQHAERIQHLEQCLSTVSETLGAQRAIAEGANARIRQVEIEHAEQLRQMERDHAEHLDRLGGAIDELRRQLDDDGPNVVRYRRPR